MKKQFKTLILCFLVVALLGTAYLVISSLLPDEDTSDTKKMMLISGSDDPMFAVKVEFPASQQDGYKYIIGKVPQSDDTILYVLQDNGIYDGFTYSQSLLEEAFTRLMSLEATELVYEEVDNLDEYGLDDANAVRVTATPYDTLSEEDADVQPITLLIGEYNSLSDAYYAKRTDQSAVYMISSTNANVFLNGPDRYRSTDILPSFGTYYDNLKSVTLHAANGEVIFMERHETFESDVEGELIYTTFRMIEPYYAYVSDTVVSEEFLDQLTSLMVMQVVENHPQDLSVYNLDEDNVITVDIVTRDDVTTTLHFGSVGSTTYVMVDGIDSVYAAYGEITFGELTTMDLRSNLVWLHNIKDVTLLEMELPDGSYKIEIDDSIDDETDTGTFVAVMNGLALSEDNGRRLYTSVISIQYDDLMANEAIEETPSYSFRITYRSGYTESVRFYKATSRQYIVCLGDETMPEASNFCANVTYLRKISENVQTILNGGTIESYT